MYERFEQFLHTRTTVVKPKKLFDTCRCAEYLRSVNTERSQLTVHDTSQIRRDCIVKDKEETDSPVLRVERFTLMCYLG
jgi:hypothetical protein